MNRGHSYISRIAAFERGQTVIAFLAARYTHSSDDEWRARIARGEVELGGRRAQADDVLRAGDVLVWHRPPWVEPDVPLAFDVLHADAEVVAVAKPSGLPTMPAGGFVEHTLFRLVRDRFGEVHPLHRLGRGTSGVVLFARTAAAASRLAAAWRAHAVRKDYRTLVDGVPAWPALDVYQPIGLVPHPRLGRVHAARDDGRRAHSHLALAARRADGAVLDVRITTGRPHQIRIHCAWAGHPLYGDPLYAAGGRPRAVDPALPGDGGYLLHAWRLTCRRVDGVDLIVEAPLPALLRAD